MTFCWILSQMIYLWTILITFKCPENFQENICIFYVIYCSCSTVTMEIELIAGMMEGHVYSTTQDPLPAAWWPCYNWVIIGSGNGFTTAECWAITWTKGGLLPIGPQTTTNFSEIHIRVHKYSFQPIWKCCLQNDSHFVDTFMYWAKHCCFALLSLS